MIFDFPELLEGNEQLLTMEQAGKALRLPKSRETVERYIRTGVRDAVLRTVKIGSRRCTTLSEIRRFELAQLQNPVSDDAIDGELMNKTSKRKTKKKTGGGKTPEEVAAGLADHGIVH